MKRVFLTVAVLSSLFLTSSFACDTSDMIGDCETISMEEMPQSLWCDSF